MSLKKKAHKLEFISQIFQSNLYKTIVKPEKIKLMENLTINQILNLNKRINDLQEIKFEIEDNIKKIICFPEIILTEDQIKTIGKKFLGINKKSSFNYYKNKIQ